MRFVKEGIQHLQASKFHRAPRSRPPTNDNRSAIERIAPHPHLSHSDSDISGDQAHTVQSPEDNDRAQFLGILPDPYTLAAQLNYVNWLDFKYHKDYPSQATHVIDVLMGEPIQFSVNSGSANQLKVRMMARQMEADTRRERPQDRTQYLATMSQRPLPERIRINSIPLLSVLSDLMSSSLEGVEEHMGQSLIILRPFKILAQYEVEIRKRYEELKYLQQNSTEDLPSLAETGLQASNPDAVPNTREDKDTRDCPGIQEAQIPKTLVDTYQPSGPRQDDRQSHHGIQYNDDTIATQHLSCLIKFIDTEIQGARKRIQALEAEATQKLFFWDLWYLFKAGDEVLYQQAGRSRYTERDREVQEVQLIEQVYRVVKIETHGHRDLPPASALRRWSGSGNTQEMILKCIRIDFDGKSLGPVEADITIEGFEGQKSITSLAAYPLRFARPHDLRRQCVSKGEMFLDIVNIKHMNYMGLTLGTRDEVDGQVVIDFDEAFSKHSEWTPRVKNLLEDPPEVTYARIPCTGSCCAGDWVHEDYLIDRDRVNDYMEHLMPHNRGDPPSLAIHPWSLAELKSNRALITEAELVIMSRRVFGFLLHSRKWGE